jgi:hypothetical protein
VHLQQRDSPLSAEENRSSAPEPEPEGVHELFASYGAGAPEEMPLGAYAILVGIYTAGLVGALRMMGREDSESEDLTPRDFLLLGLATHKLSRLISKDVVTSPFRAPFATFEESTGANEVRELPRGKGMQKALGELLTCPMCVAPWVGGVLAFGMLLKPNTTRLVTSTFAAVAVSDFLQHLYVGAKQSLEEKEP